MQAASNPPIAIRCKRSYVFSLDGHHTGDTILTFNLCAALLRNLIKNVNISYKHRSLPSQKNTLYTECLIISVSHKLWVGRAY